MTDLVVPWLRSGKGKTPADGGCILQVIDFVDRGGWTDAPECVHPVLRAVAIQVNDSLDDADRQRLLDLVPRLMGTASDDRVLTVRLAVFCARQVLPVFEADRPGDDRPRRALEVAEAWCDNPTAANAASAYAAAEAAACASDAAAAAAAANAADAAYASDNANNAYANAAADYADYAADAAAYAANNAAEAACAAAADKLGFLVALLDEYDRLTGRTAPTERPDYSGVCAVMAGGAS